MSRCVLQLLKAIDCIGSQCVLQLLKAIDCIGSRCVFQIILKAIDCIVSQCALQLLKAIDCIERLNNVFFNVIDFIDGSRCVLQLLYIVI